LPDRGILRRLNKRLQFILRFALSRKLTSFFRSRQPAVVLLTPVGDGHLFIAGESAATLLNLPTILWILDDWVGGAGKELPWAVDKMSTVLQRCAARSVARFAVSKEMAKRYEGELGGRWEVLCNGVEPGCLPDVVLPPEPSGRSLKIGFFGAVYSIQIDPIEAVCEACQKLGMEMIVYGDVDPNVKSRLSRFDCLTLRELVPEEVARAEMKRCDALYLPYSFNTSAARVVETSFPTKMADYIVSGKPVIINGPPNSTIINFSRRTGWGIPVDGGTAEALEDALRGLQHEYGECVRQSSVAAKRAADELDLSRMRDRFREALSVVFTQRQRASGCVTARLF
jgi:glycosyltransferase involved in cell wall biosynthesis